MLRAALILLVAGCGQVHAVGGAARSYAIAIDDDCSAADPFGLLGGAVDAASRLWSQWGVEEDPDDPDERFTICVVPEPPHGDYIGWNQPEPGRASRIEIWGELEAPHWGTTLAHEMGHGILPGPGDSDHLPEGQTGILSAHTRTASQHSWTWSPDDHAQLEAYGLAYLE